MANKKNKKEPGPISRKDFLKGAGVIVGSAALGSTLLLAACAGEETTETKTVTQKVTSLNTITETATTTETLPPVTTTKTVGPNTRHVIEELPLPGLRPLGTTEFSCDVLVIGASYAGAQAALGAYDAGLKVIVVDKGIPGKSGAGPWANTLLFFDESLYRKRRF